MKNILLAVNAFVVSKPVKHMSDVQLANIVLIFVPNGVFRSGRDVIPEQPLNMLDITPTLDKSTDVKAVIPEQPDHVELAAVARLQFIAGKVPVIPEQPAHVEFILSADETSIEGKVPISPEQPDHAC